MDNPQPTSPTPPTEEKQRQIMQIENDNTLWFDNRVWSIMKEMAREFQMSGALPKNMTVQQALLAIQAGREIGMMPVAALTYIAFVNGRATLFGDGAIMQVVRAGHKVEFTNCDDKTATCAITRKDDGRSMSATFTMDMANKRGLTAKGGPWVTAPENMLKFKAFHMIAKFIVPDALHGMGLYEVEAAEIDEPLRRSTGVSETMANVASIVHTKGKLKPLAARLAEKEKPETVDGEVVDAVAATELRPNQAVKINAEGKAEPAEPRYEPIEEKPAPTPVIQVEEPPKKSDIEKVLPVKPNETAAAKKMREAAEKARNSNDF